MTNIPAQWVSFSGTFINTNYQFTSIGCKVAFFDTELQAFDAGTVFNTARAARQQHMVDTGQMMVEYPIDIDPVVTKQVTLVDMGFVLDGEFYPNEYV